MRKASGDQGGHEHSRYVLVARALAAAWRAHDVAGLASLFEPDVGVVVDGGGRAGVSAQPVRGVGDGVGLLLRVFASQPGCTVAEQSVNGRPGLVVRRDRIVVAVVSLELCRGRVQDVWIVLNPEKLERWNRMSQPPPLGGLSW